MNMLVERSEVAAALAAGGRGAHWRAPVQANVTPIAAGLSAVSFEIETGRAAAGRLGGEIAGEALPRPALATRLALRRGGWRHVLLLGRSADAVAGAPCRFTMDDRDVAMIDPSWLQSPLIDMATLVEGLSEAGRARLFHALLTTAASLFGGAEASGFGAAVERLLRLFAVPELGAATQCALGAAGRVVSFRLPAELGAPRVDALVAVAGDRVARLARGAARLEDQGRGRILHVIAPDGLAGGGLIALGAAPLALGLGADTRAEALGPWLARRPREIREWIEAAAGAAARGAGPLMRELRHGDAPAPGLALRHLSATPGGALVLADVADPHGLLAAVRVEIGGVARDLPITGRGAVGGFIATPRPREPGAVSVWRLVYGSGRVQTVLEARAEPYDGGAPEVFARLGTAAAAEALAAARLARGRQGCAPVETVIGAPPRRPRLSLVMAAGSSPDLLRARLAMLFREPGAGSVEVICHAPASAGEATAQVMRDGHAVFGLGVRVLVLPDACDPAERLRAALEAARGPAALALGEGAAPVGLGWLALWTAALRRPRGPVLIGGAMLAADGSVEHAGGVVVFDADRRAARIERRWLGLPAAALPAAPSVAAATVSGACFAVNRRAIDALSGFSPHYPEAGALMAAFAAHLGRRRVRVLLAGRCLRFDGGDAAQGSAAEADARALAAMIGGPGIEGGGR